MRRTPLPASPFVFFNPALLWVDLAMKSTEMLISSGQVIGARVDRMARAGLNPSARDRKEFALMTNEKVRAANQSSVAMAKRMQSLNGTLWTRAWQQWFASLGAMVAFASSKTPGQAMARQADVWRTTRRSATSLSEASQAMARIAHSGLKPVHRTATANARRLAPKR
jgi:hypothetical protein